MLPERFDAIRRQWRNELFSTEPWTPSSTAPIAPGEAGGYRVQSGALVAYLKPTQICPEDHPRAANEKIVSDLAFELKMNVPPVLLYRRTAPTPLEETRCCVSLILYPSVYEWGFLWNMGTFPEGVQQMIRTMIARYSSTLALDLLIQQTDRDNARNGVFCTDPGEPAYGELLFLDHSNTLHFQNRWNGDAWNRVTLVPLPATFRGALDKARVIEGAKLIEALPDETIRAIIDRIPDDFMSHAHKQRVTMGLIGRKSLVRPFVESSL